MVFHLHGPLPTLTPSIFTRFTRRFYRNFTNSSPTSKAGFLPLENVQKMLQEQEESKRMARINSKIPEGLAALFSTRDHKRPLQSLKGPLHPLEIDTLVNSYPNQSRPNILSLLKIHKPASTLSLSSLSSLSPEAAFSLAESLQAQFDSEADAFVQCANVLKKRRRRMRGHKHKKRLKERRHKADK